MGDTGSGAWLGVVNRADISGLSFLLRIQNNFQTLLSQPHNHPLFSCSVDTTEEMARTTAYPRVSTMDHGETSLDAAMRAPSTTTPDVVVLNHVEDNTKAKEVADPRKDLWLSSVDG